MNGRPFAAWQLDWLAGSGITSIVYCVGYLGSDVREYVGDGARWGLSVNYVDEGVLAEDFLVLYGDSWLQVNPAAVLSASRERREPALMTVYGNDGRWDTSNVVFDGHRVVRYAKGLTERPADMRWIDYGLTTLRRDLIADRVPPATVADLAPLQTALADEGLLAGYEVADRFYEIGSVDGRRELEQFLEKQSP